MAAAEGSPASAAAVPAAAVRRIHGIDVRGVDVDAETRCGHWHGTTDIIALKFKCCSAWYPCIDCHRELAGHPAKVWPLDERDAQAVLCGACGHRLSIVEYLNCDATCPCCRAAFNPGCALHHHLYFEPNR